MRAVFVDTTGELAAFSAEVPLPAGLTLDLSLTPDIAPDAIPGVIGDAGIAFIDHTSFPTPVAARCRSLRHVVFMGTGARSYMDVEALADLGITVHVIKGYGDRAVAECALALLFAAAKGLALMDGRMRRGHWLRVPGVQLGGKTLGLVGFGGIGAELAAMAAGVGMRVLAWNRTPRMAPGVEFVSIERLLAESDAVSLHLLLVEETRGFLSRERIARMKGGAILVNTARGALVDEAAMIEALRSGRLGHAGLDVFTVEPLPDGHPLLELDNVTLSAHSAFRTPEAGRALIAAAYGHCRAIIAKA